MKMLFTFFSLISISACAPNHHGEHASYSSDKVFPTTVVNWLEKAQHGDHKALAELQAKGEQGDQKAQFLLYAYYTDDRHTNYAEAYFWGMLLEGAFGAQQDANHYLSKQLTTKQKIGVDRRLAQWKKAHPRSAPTIND
jgi:hypothetical protein